MEVIAIHTPDKPVILLDKSAFQRFSSKEIRRLYRHYDVLVPSILVFEILDNLVQKRRKAKLTPEKWVQALANRLDGGDSHYSVDHAELNLASLLEKPIPMDGRVLSVRNMKMVGEGKSKGIIF